MFIFHYNPSRNPLILSKSLWTNFKCPQNHPQPLKVSSKFTWKNSLQVSRKPQKSVANAFLEPPGCWSQLPTLCQDMACHLARSITNHRDMIWWLWVKVRIPNRTAKLIVGCAYHDEHLWATGSTIFPIKWSGWFAPTRWRPVELFNKRRSQTLWWIFLAFMDDLSLLWIFLWNPQTGSSAGNSTKYFFWEILVAGKRGENASLFFFQMWIYVLMF